MSDSCPDPIYRTAASVTDLITKLKAANFKDKMLEVLKAEVPKDTRMFTGA